MGVFLLVHIKLSDNDFGLWQTKAQPCLGFFGV